MENMPEYKASENLKSVIGRESDANQEYWIEQVDAIDSMGDTN